MREAANILDLIRAKRRLSERDKAFLEAMADALDEFADGRTMYSARGNAELYDARLQRAAEAYNTTKED